MDRRATMVGRSEDQDEGLGFVRLNVWCKVVVVEVVLGCLRTEERERSRRALAARSHGIQAMSLKAGIVLGRAWRWEDEAMSWIC